MRTIFLAFFTMWAGASGCSSVRILPPTEVVHGPWVYRISSADACGDVEEIIESVYKPHGDVLERAYLRNGARVYDLPNLDNLAENAAS